MFFKDSYEYLSKTTGIPKSTLYPQVNKLIKKGWIVKEKGRLIIKSYKSVYNDQKKNRKIKGSNPKELLENMRFAIMRNEENRQRLAFRARCGKQKRSTVISCPSGFSGLDASPHFSLSYQTIGLKMGLSRSGAIKAINKLVFSHKINKGHVWEYCFKISYSFFIQGDFDKRYFWNKGNLYEQKANHYSTRKKRVGISIRHAWKLNSIHENMTGLKTG